MFTIDPGVCSNFCNTYNAKTNGHNSCTVPTLWPSFRYFSRSLNSGNLECISYWDIKYFTAKKLKREHHSFAFPYFMHFLFLITFHILRISSAFNPRRMRVLDMGEHENQQICGVWHRFCHVVRVEQLLHSLFQHVSPCCVAVVLLGDCCIVANEVLSTRLWTFLILREDMETWQCLGFIVKQVKFHKEWLDLPRCHSALTAACLAKASLCLLSLWKMGSLEIRPRRPCDRAQAVQVPELQSQNEGISDWHKIRKQVIWWLRKAIIWSSLI